jgi:hypothetical protein
VVSASRLREVGGGGGGGGGVPRVPSELPQGGDTGGKVSVEPCSHHELKEPIFEIKLMVVKKIKMGKLKNGVIIYNVLSIKKIKHDVLMVLIKIIHRI